MILKDLGETFIAKSLAYSNTALSNSASGKVLLTIPICSASVAVNFLDENKISFALAIPTNLGRIQPTPHSAISPLFEKALENTAPSFANLISA